MAAAAGVQKRLQEENAALRQQLADAGITAAAPPAADGAAAADAPASDGGASLSAFDAAVAPTEEVATLGFPPASLDPDEVLHSLPQAMQDAFDALDVAALHAALAALPPAEASEYMRRCVASGLWDPNGGGGGAAPVEAS